ncbi:MAG: hypothetical protein QOG52_1170, partial [Frankiaceae bacterium]|nr:hypothetical protein [Frankiaceae bacterium]
MPATHRTFGALRRFAMACGIVLGVTLATPGLASAATDTYPGG